jgi:hypothetical protein
MQICPVLYILLQIDSCLLTSVVTTRKIKDVDSYDKGT